MGKRIKVFKHSDHEAVVVVDIDHSELMQIGLGVWVNRTTKEIFLQLSKEEKHEV